MCLTSVSSNVYVKINIQIFLVVMSLIGIDELSLPTRTYHQVEY